MNPAAKGRAMNWQPLKQFRDPAVPKLHNLRRASAAGLRVPPTWWLDADVPARISPPALPLGPPLILRSGSPSEDGEETSNAGRFVSLVVEALADYPDALRRVVEALPLSPQGKRLGVVFVQTLVRGDEAGVAFFDGFYFERTRTAGLNVALTAGQARGEVTRGHLASPGGRPDQDWSAWLASVYRVFGGKRGHPCLDVEYSRDREGYVLLQVRPALFAVQRNPLLTQANLKETFGDWPSPWSVSGLVEAGKDVSFLVSILPVIGEWNEALMVEVGERAWVNLSVWLRVADLMGIPRTVPLHGLGGVQTTAADRRVGWWRLPRRLWRLALGELRGLVKAMQARRELARFDEQIARARGLPELHQVWVQSWRLGMDTAMAVMGVLIVVVLFRTFLRLPGRARLVTQEMMDEYQALARLPADRRAAGLDDWLRRHGHRGPGESDVARPRFAELRDVLLADLAGATPVPQPPRPAWWRLALEWPFRPLWWLDARREWFRDQCMRRLQVIRSRLLEEGARLVAEGRLDRPEDLFWLRWPDWEKEGPLQEAVKAARARQELARRSSLPLTADLDTIQERLRQAAVEEERAAGQTVLAGFPLTPVVFEGRVRKVADLVELLGDSAGLDAHTVLVVPSLEPSWAVVFPRIGGVIAEVGGELSHASILLREARKPAVVNVAGIWQAVRDGDRVRLDGRRGVVEVLAGP
jgi:pyruvate,water dikinase